MSASIEGTVERIRFVSADTHWTVATVRVDQSPASVAVVGVMPGLAEGMRIKAEGEWVEDPRWGRQLKVTTFTERVPASRGGIASYLASGFIPGVGPKLAERIVAHFGTESLHIIRNAPLRLTEVRGLGAKRAESIATSLEKRRGGQEALVYLYGLGLTPGLAMKIHQKYGADTVMTVRRNPWLLAEEVHGIGFSRADQVARGMDIPLDHPARRRAGALHVLLTARGDGHCFVPRRLLVETTAQLTGLEPDLIEPAVADLVASGKAKLSDRPEDPTDPAVYLLGLYEAERRVARQVAALLRSPPPVDPDVEPRVASAQDALGFELAPEQAAAVRRALSEGTTIITGGPGTGKTTIIRTLLTASGLKPHELELAAPTGRAAKRMSEATGYDARTIHRLLEFSPQDGCFQRNEENPLETRLVIIDEASMADLLLFDALVRAIPIGARLVLVGDVDQLPPVGPGSPLTDLIRSERVAVARLSRIFRQGRGSAIVDSAHRINAGTIPEVTPPGTPIQDFYFIHRAEPDEIVATIEELVAERIPRRFGLDPMRQVQVLSPMRAGAVGVDRLNLRLQALLNPDGEALTIGQSTFRRGDRVMQLRNDYDRGVYNGDMGFVDKVNASDRQLIVNIDDKPIIYEGEQLYELVLAYAISVHKSQGSEYPAVVMPITTHHFKMLQRNLIYTGVTRGRQLVVLVGTPRAMGIAVRNSHVSTRNTLLAERLRLATSGHGNLELEAS